MNTASSLVKSVRIPPRPEILVDIANEINSPNPDIDRVAAALKKDVTLYGAILRLVNSPALGFSNVRSIDHAILLLGFARVGQLAQAIALRNQLGVGVRMDRFWDTAAEVADVTASLALKFTGISIEDAYTVGLFHDFGIPVMMQSFPDFKSLMAAVNQDQSLNLATAETERYGFNHYEAGFELGKTWFVPESLNWTILLQPQLDEVLAEKIVIDDAERVRTLLSLLELAKNISGTYRKFWRSNNDASAASVAPAALKFLNIDEVEYRELREDMMRELGKTSSQRS